MSGIEQARVLLQKAREDFDLLNAIANDPTVSDSIFGFHAQQSVEKAIKAWIWALGSVPQKTHDIETLTDVLLELRGSPVAELDVLQDLGVFAVIYRYEVFDWEEAVDRNRVIGDITLFLARAQNAISAPLLGDRPKLEEE